MSPLLNGYESQVFRRIDYRQEFVKGNPQVDSEIRYVSLTVVRSQEVEETKDPVDSCGWKHLVIQLKQLNTG